MKKIWIVICVLIAACTSKRQMALEKSGELLDKIAEGTAIEEFPEKYFPKDQTVILMDQLQNNCDFKDRKGNFINDYYEKNLGGEDRVSFIYEYYLKCDSLRFIMTYNLGPEIELYRFRIESIKKNNNMILKPERRLKWK
ncbi:MAG TPA: hypothetical protein VG605_09730 [Puia sp.]|nr:hypothetical protein [Puia sp.]